MSSFKARLNQAMHKHGTRPLSGGIALTASQMLKAINDAEREGEQE
jgi:hypothetical protein